MKSSSLVVCLCPLALLLVSAANAQHGWADKLAGRVGAAVGGSSKSTVKAVGDVAGKKARHRDQAQDQD